MTDASPELIVRNNPAAQSYDAVKGDKVIGRVHYVRSPASPSTPPAASPSAPHFTIHSTVVDPQMRGYGIGSVLLQAALDDIRAQGATLTSYCSFVDDYIAAYPEYADLLAPA